MPKAANIPSYPSPSDIRYAVWLKNFATRLPDYVDRYQVAPATILEVQCMALDFVDLLSHRLQDTTAHIRWGQEPATKLPPPPVIGPWQEHITSLQKTIAKLTNYIQQHPVYSAADGHSLGLLLPR